MISRGRGRLERYNQGSAIRLRKWGFHPKGSMTRVLQSSAYITLVVK